MQAAFLMHEEIGDNPTWSFQVWKWKKKEADLEKDKEGEGKLFLISLLRDTAKAKTLPW